MKRMLPLAFTLCLLLCGCMSRTENRGVEKIGGADGITGIVVGDSRENDSSLGAFRVCTYEGPLYPDTFCYILTLKAGYIAVMVFLRFLLSIERTSRCRLIRDAGIHNGVLPTMSMPWYGSLWRMAEARYSISYMRAAVLFC